MKVIPPSQRRSKRTQHKILTATEQLLATRAFDQISVAMITTKAGISVGNFYNRFPEKSGLLAWFISNIWMSAASFWLP